MGKKSKLNRGLIISDSGIIEGFTFDGQEYLISGIKPCTDYARFESKCETCGEPFAWLEKRKRLLHNIEVDRRNCQKHRKLDRARQSEPSNRTGPKKFSRGLIISASGIIEGVTFDGQKYLISKTGVKPDYALFQSGCRICGEPILWITARNRIAEGLEGFVRSCPEHARQKPLQQEAA